MRAFTLVVLLALVAVLGQTPAEAQGYVGKGGALGLGLQLVPDSWKEYQGGRCRIWFESEGVCQFVYTGGSTNILVPDFLLPLRVFAEWQMNAPQWGNVSCHGDGWQAVEDERGKTIPNFFTCELLPGANQVEFRVPYRERTRRLGLWVEAETRRSKTRYEFVVQRASLGASDYAIQKAIAPGYWPNVDRAWDRLWASVWCLEKYYQSQGLVLFGTVERPVSSTQSLRQLLEGMQQGLLRNTPLEEFSFGIPDLAPSPPQAPPKAEARACGASNQPESQPLTVCRELRLIGFPSGQLWLEGPAGVTHLRIPATPPEQQGVAVRQLELPLGSYRWFYRPYSGREVDWKTCEVANEIVTITAPSGAEGR